MNKISGRSSDTEGAAMVETSDRRGAIFWLLLSIAALAESVRMGLGTVQNPGMGFMSFGASGLLGILSLVLLLKTAVRRTAVKPVVTLSGSVRRKAFIVLVSLAVYSRFMPVAGYLISTFLLMCFLYWFLEPDRTRSVFWSVILSLLTTLISYYIFSVLLNCQFPAGLFGL